MILKALVNTVISMILLYLFTIWGWITLQESALPVWLTLLFISIVTGVVYTLICSAYLLLVGATCGGALLLLPVLVFAGTWFALLGTSSVTHWFTVNVDFFWLGMLMNAMYVFIKIPNTVESS